MGNFLREAWARIWRTLVLTFRIYGEIEGEQRAAAFAYYVLFSLFPLVALLLTFGATLVSPEQIISFIEAILPMNYTQQAWIWDTVKKLEEARGGISIVSLVILLWGSLRFFQALVRGVNRAWHTVEIPWWQIPLKNLLMIAIIGSALLFGILAPAVLQGVTTALIAAEAFIHERLPGFNLHLISSILDWSRYIIGGIVLFYSFTLLYMLAPRRRVYFRQVWLPALVVTILTQFCQISFVNYLPRFINYNHLYGSIGGLLLLLLWVYVSGMLIILGGCFCAALDKLNEPPDVEKISGDRDRQHAG
jgi:YihY family inner membrane protein